MHREHEHCESEADEKAREEAEAMARNEAHAAPDASAKMAILFCSLWRDAEDESRSLRALLTGAQKEVCSMLCRSAFPAGHVRSDADHSDKCRAITNALSDASADAADRVAVGDGIAKETD